MRRGFTGFTITALTLGFAFLYLPIVLLVIYSFNASKLVTVWGGFSTKWYGELFRDPQILGAAWISLQLVPLLPAGLKAFADLGSGSGFPAIPTAIAHVQEARGEFSAKVRLTGGGRTSFEGGVTYERSRITNNYPFSPGTNLGYLRPRLDARFTGMHSGQFRLTVERKISQRKAFHGGSGRQSGLIEIKQMGGQSPTFGMAVDQKYAHIGAPRLL